MLDTQDRPQPESSDDSTLSECCAESHDEQPMEPEKERKLPLWAILLAVGAFLIFNAFFLSFALSVSSTSPQ